MKEAFKETSSKITHSIYSKYRRVEEAFVLMLNTHFNRMSTRQKKIIVWIFGTATGSICMLLIAGALLGNEKTHSISVGQISNVQDAYMKSEADKSSNDQLIPIGKMKGEIANEFDSFYVAVDKDAKIYINRSIEYSSNAYEKSDRWEQITKAQLEEYGRSLHFLPLYRENGNSIKR